MKTLFSWSAFAVIVMIGATNLHSNTFDSWARNEIALNNVKNKEVSEWTQLNGALQQMEEKLYETNSL